jgi:hypothetical protein
MYFTVDTVGRNPKNMTNIPKAWDSAAYYFSKGYHYDYWDGDLVSDKLNSSDHVWQYVDTAGPPPDNLIRACKAVSETLGRPAYLVDDGWKFCKEFPEHLKREGDRNITYPDGTVIDPFFWWNSGCKIPRHPDGSHNTYWWSCKISDNNTMLWDANTFGADPTDTTNTNSVTWGFNLPWDVACCCCGGGTSANKPGDQITFKINPEFPDIAAKLTKPNYTDLTKFVSPDGLYINTTGHPDWVDRLYPEAKSTDFAGGLVYIFPNVTFSAEFPEPYAHDNGNSSVCQDLTLDDDIENYTLSFKARPKVWVDWSSYDCRYYSEDACSGGQASKSWNSSGWGPFQFFYNGHIRNGTGHGPRNVTQLRAHAGNVCCACGGGKVNGQLNRDVDDFDYDANFLRRQAPKPRRSRAFRRHTLSTTKQPFVV